MRKTLTTLLTALCVACGTSATLAAEASRPADANLRASFDYNGASRQVVPSGAFNPLPIADAGYETVVTDDAAAAPAKTSDSTSCCDATSCCSSCGCGNSCGWCLGDCLKCDCCLGEPWTLASCLTPCCECGPTYGGWIETGYYNKNARLSFAQSDGLDIRDYPDHLNFDQVWFYVEKKAETGSCCCEYGYRFDVMYGVDAQTAESFGNPRALDGPNLGAWDASFDNGPYGWAMPQAYVEVARGDWSWKLGRFFTPLGYEVLPATGNFFYSHSLTWYNSEPIGHTGALGTYTANDCMTWYAGWTLGYDSGFDQFDGGSNFVGGFTRKMNDCVSFTYLTGVGNLGWRSGGSFGYNHSIVVNNKISECLNYVLVSDMVQTEGTITDNDFHNHDYSFANYLIYKLSDCWSAGGRAEWWKSNSVTGESKSYQEITGGLNYHPRANLVLRPEIRYDWTNEGGGVPDNYNQVFFGVDGVFTF